MKPVLVATYLGLTQRRCLYRRRGLAVIAEGGGYSITHEYSGMQVALVETLPQARALLHRLAPLTDWTRDEAWLAARKGLAARVRKAVGK